MSRTSPGGNIACVDISRGPGAKRRVPDGNCPGKGISRPHWLGGSRRVGTPLVRKS